MNLYDARVVVIDDKYEEVKKLLNLLSRNGITFNYYKGTDYKEIPNEPLRGVRILFLDFVLGTDGQSERNKISVLMNVLKKIVSKQNGPYLILAWTTHDLPADDLLSPFKNELIKNKDIPKPIRIINLDKKNCMASLKKIQESINKNFTKDNPVRLLLTWEENAKKAQNAVLNSIIALSEPKNMEENFDTHSDRLNNELETILYKIAEAELGKNAKNKKLLVPAIQLLLTNIFQDHLEHIIRCDNKFNKALAKKLLASSDREFSSEKAAEMHTSFLIMQDTNAHLQPGNVYDAIKTFKKIKCTTSKCYTNKIRISKIDIIRAFYKKSGDQDFSNHKLELQKKTIPILMEITPECDYVQNEWKNAKFILGILWPERIEGLDEAGGLLQKQGNYIYKPFLIKYNEEMYYFVLNSYYTFIFNFGIFKSLQPLFKARKELLVDVQHWYSKHISRPGKIEFNSRR